VDFEISYPYLKLHKQLPGLGFTSVAVSLERASGALRGNGLKSKRELRMTNWLCKNKQANEINWMFNVKHLLVISISLTLFACGGGGGDGVDGGGTATFTLLGKITAANNIAVDSDLNDPLAPYVENNDFNNNFIDIATSEDFANAQSLVNPVMLNGFVSRQGTLSQGDRFESSPDIADMFRISLYGGQYVSLRIASFDSSAPMAYDVDFQVYDSGFNLIATSDSYTEFESYQVPDGSDGEYYIRVYAHSGTNKYVLSVGSTSLSGAIATTAVSADFIPYQAIIKRSPQTLMAKSSESLGQMDGVTLSHDSRDRNVLLSMTPSSNFMTLMSQSAKALEADGGMQAIPEETRQKIETLRMIKQLNLRGDIESASPNFIYRAMREPNDTYYSYQEHYRQIRLPQAWDITTGTPATGDVIVAVIDTGLATDHEDFTDQLVSGYDFISDTASSRDGDGIDNDPNDPGTSEVPGESVFHGTHVAGTIAAASNNSRGVAGVSWGAKIMPLRVLGLGGSGSSYDIEQAVRYAARLPNDSNTVPNQAADIINLSLGGAGFSQQSQDLYTQVRNSGVIIIAAAGNNNSSELFYPASYDGVVSVSAMDWENDKAPYSNYGSAVDVGAPGGDLSVDNNGDSYSDGILSCVMNDSTGVPQSNYRFLQGTSMASPHVAGVVALMKAAYPDLTPAILDSMLSSGEMTNDMGDTGRDDIYGYGMIDALKSVQAASAAASNPAPDTVIVTPTSLNFGFNLNEASVTLTGQGTNPPGVVSIDSSEPWLSVAANSVDADGLGTYTLTVDRTDLVDAVYSATVDFVLNDTDATTLSISVSMRKLTQTTDIVGNAGYLYLVLFDLSSNNQGQLALSPNNGTYNFQLTGVAEGEYYLVAGSDVDNDGLICEVGESCGAYPLQGREEVVNVTGDMTGLDFLATINSGLSGTAGVSFALPVKGIPIKSEEKDVKAVGQ
jgi:serine protease